jgi:hypothetical protein
MGGIDSKDELALRLHADRDKYAYFLMAAAGSCLAFAVQKTEGVMISIRLMPLAISAAFWILSFYFGCGQLRSAQDLKYANHVYLEAREQNDAQGVLITRQRILDVNAEWNSHARRQFRLLVWGGVFFLTWHAWNIWAHSHGSSVWAQ